MIHENSDFSFFSALWSLSMHTQVSDIRKPELSTFKLRFLVVRTEELLIFAFVSNSILLEMNTD